MHWGTSCSIYLLATFALSSVGQGVDSFRAIRQEYCDRGNLCVTSFDWCQFGPEYSPNTNFSTGYCDRRGIGPGGDVDFVWSPGNGGLAGVTVLLYSFYNLTWSGADPAYPVQVDFTFGPPQGPINRTTPLWSRNVTEPFFRFRFWDFFLEVADQDTNSNASYVGYGLGWTSFFTISQPGRPPSPDLNFTESSNEFLISNLDIRGLDRQYRDIAAMRQAQQSKRWRLGVGIGVGLGVPLLLLVSHVLGRSGGKKAVRKESFSREASGKRVSNFSDEHGNTAPM